MRRFAHHSSLITLIPPPPPPPSPRRHSPQLSCQSRTLLRFVSLVRLSAASRRPLTLLRKLSAFFPPSLHEVGGVDYQGCLADRGPSCQNRQNTVIIHSTLTTTTSSALGAPLYLSQEQESLGPTCRAIPHTHFLLNTPQHHPTRISEPHSTIQRPFRRTSAFLR